MASLQWDDDLLVLASRVVAYEWRMLRGCSEVLGAKNPPKPNTYERNVYVEALLVHTRALIEFFWNCNSRSTDIHVSRWFAEDSEEHRHFADSKHRCRLWSEKDEIDKRLAHITSVRIPKVTHSYDLSVTILLDKLLRRFVQDAGDRVGPELKALASEGPLKYSGDTVVNTSGNVGAPGILENPT